jgi:hypothetical protein
MYMPVHFAWNIETLEAYNLSPFNVARSAPFYHKMLIMYITMFIIKLIIATLYIQLVLLYYAMNLHAFPLEHGLG